jgi:hypothetical protein
MLNHHQMMPMTVANKDLGPLVSGNGLVKPVAAHRTRPCQKFRVCAHTQAIFYTQATTRARLQHNIPVRRYKKKGRAHKE